jgi:hypothetical protein
MHLAEVAAREDLEILEGPRDMGFDANDNLIPVATAGATAGVL